MPELKPQYYFQTNTGMINKGQVAALISYLRARLAAPMVVVSGLLIITAVFLNFRIAEKERFLFEFTTAAGNHATVLQNSVNEQLGALNSISGWFMAAHANMEKTDSQVLRARFASMAPGVLASHPALLFLGIAMRVTAEELGAFESEQSAGGLAQFRVHRLNKKSSLRTSGARPSDVYFPLFLLAPGQTGKFSYGLDIYSIQVYRQAMLEAVEYKSWRGVMDPDDKDVLLVFSPLFAGADRQTRPFAYTVAKARLSRLAGEAFEGMAMGGFRFYLYDPGGKPLYASYEGAPLADWDAGAVSVDEDSPFLARNLYIAGRKFSLVIKPTADYLARSASWRPWYIMWMGVAFTLFLGAYIEKTLKYTAIVEAEVTKRTGELARAEEQARRKDSELAHAMRLVSLGEMAAGITHEVSQPLGAIMNYAENALELVEDCDTNKVAVKETLVKITGQVMRASKVISGLKSYSRSQDSALEKVNINTLVETVADFFRRRMELGGIMLETELNRTVPEILGYSLQLEQALVNVISNAIDSLEGMQTKRISVTTALRADGEVEVIVSDTGAGLEKETLAKLFQPFFTTKPRGKGTGLGMSICKKIIEKHGGTITAKSQPGQGTAMTIRLPSQMTYADKG